MNKKLIVYGASFVAVVAIVGFFVGVITAASFSLNAKPESEKVETYAAAGKISFAPIVDKTSTAVVSIEGERTVVYRSPYYDFFDDPFFRRFFGEVPRKNLEQEQKWLGSGFIVEYKGKDYILTNNHVVKDAQQLTVSLSDERKFSGNDLEVIGRDPETEVAVIRIKKGGDLPDITPGSVEDLKVGDWVIAIGNPFGLFGTVTAGVVSAKGRSEVSLSRNIYADFIQTDAAINQGNSGGPLINSEGKVVGVNTMIVSQTGGNIGIGFAVPIDIAMDVLQSLVETGTVERGYLGIVPENLSQEIKKALNYPYEKGVYVMRVEEETPAAEAGLAEGDIILTIDNKKIEDVNILRKLIASKSPNAKVEVTVWRNGGEKTLTVKMGKRPAGEVSSRPMGGEEWLGMLMLPATSKEAESIWGDKAENGVFVSEVKEGSLADKAGVIEKSLITLVQAKNRSMKINDIEDIKIAKKDFNPPLVLLLNLPDGSIRVISIGES
ncbi:Do family serine endopeptidase [candidate division WOR-3 bacterium]|nr:Do family serine endopeptidase [candidate division WOR-3 bacterium]